MTWLKASGRWINPAHVESIRIDEQCAAVWLAGKSEPLQCSESERGDIKRYIELSNRRGGEYYTPAGWKEIR